MNTKQHSDNVLTIMSTNEQLDKIDKELKYIRLFNVLTTICLSILLINFSNNLVQPTPTNANITVNQGK
jgi:hypothetical protein